MAIVCCDTSFLFSLYSRDSLTQRAVALARQLRQPVVVSILNEFELENSIRLSIFRKTIHSVEAAAMFADYAADKSLGKVVLVTCDLPDVLTQAKGLSVAHSQGGGHRAYDILHIAAALRLGATEFVSFDMNQRKLAKAVGLKIKPA
jgi:predicted nucleic acid-binding protein